MKIKIFDPKCRPYKKYSEDAGWDLRARIAEPIRFHSMMRKTISVGIAIEIPPGYVGDVRPRSGLAKKGLVAMYGTIDATYRGEIKVTLINLGIEPVEIQPYERIAQLVILPILKTELEEAVELSETERGSGGFGSTGKF